jgi:hypothetical protein
MGVLKGLGHRLQRHEVYEVHLRKLEADDLHPHSAQCYTSAPTTRTGLG